MPFVFIIIGVVLVVAGVRDTYPALMNLIKQDFSGKGSFEMWALAIFIIGAIGYIKTLQPLSRAFMILVVVVLVLKSGTGFFDQFNSQLTNQSQNNSSQSGNGSSNLVYGSPTSGGTEVNNLPTLIYQGE